MNEVHKQAAPRRNSENPYLWPMLRSLPYFRALLRAVEAGFYDQFDMPAPVLDLGCGDGHFAAVVFRKPIDVGIDPSGSSLREAKRGGAYQSLVQSLGSRIPFPGAYFSSAFSNSVLEHIPNFKDVLKETARVMKRDGLFLFCVPNDNWAKSLQVSAWFNRIGLRRSSQTYTRFFILISRHVNMLSPEEWRNHLEQAGFRLEDHWHYFPPQALHLLEWGHFFGLPSLFVRILTGRWILVPERWNLALTQGVVSEFSRAEKHPEGTYTWFVARRN